MENLISLVAFGVFVVAWAAFAYGVLASQGSLDAAWTWINGLPLLLRVVVWLLLLPVALGLWIWHADWALAVRLVLVLGLAIATLYTFLPRWLWEGRG